MRTISVRTALTCAMVVLLALPQSLFAADTRAAMVYARGTAWINGVNIPRSSAIFPGDLVQTKSDSVANINAQGSNVSVFSDSLVKFEGDTISLEHGGVTVATSKGLTTRAGDVTITPSSASLTEFRVLDLDGTVRILASKGDLSISDDSGTSTLSAGQETSREEAPKRGKRKRNTPGAVTAAQGGLLDSKGAVIVGTGVIGGIGVWLLLSHEDPISPDH